MQRAMAGAVACAMCMVAGVADLAARSTATTRTLAASALAPASGERAAVSTDEPTAAVVVAGLWRAHSQKLAWPPWRRIRCHVGG
jgi:hypothetical protein